MTPHQDRQAIGSCTGVYCWSSLTPFSFYFLHSIEEVLTNKGFMFRLNSAMVPIGQIAYIKLIGKYALDRILSERPIALIAIDA